MSSRRKRWAKPRRKGRDKKASRRREETAHPPKRPARAPIGAGRDSSKNKSIDRRRSSTPASPERGVATHSTPLSLVILCGVVLIVLVLLGRWGAGSPPAVLSYAVLVVASTLLILGLGVVLGVPPAAEALAYVSQVLSSAFGKARSLLGDRPDRRPDDPEDTSRGS